MMNRSFFREECETICNAKDLCGFAFGNNEHYHKILNLEVTCMVPEPKETNIPGLHLLGKDSK